MYSITRTPLAECIQLIPIDAHRLQSKPIQCKMHEKNKTLDVGELLFPTRVIHSRRYGWSGWYAMSVMTTRVMWLVGNDQDPHHLLGFWHLSNQVKNQYGALCMISAYLIGYCSHCTRSLFTLYNNKTFVIHQQ